MRKSFIYIFSIIIFFLFILNCNLLSEAEISPDENTLNNDLLIVEDPPVPDPDPTYTLTYIYNTGFYQVGVSSTPEISINQTVTVNGNTVSITTSEQFQVAYNGQPTVYDFDKWECRISGTSIVDNSYVQISDINSASTNAKLIKEGNVTLRPIYK